MQMNASMVAREALRQLAQRRLLPTPDNYTRIYYEIAAPDGKHVSLAPATMLRELAETLIRRGNDGAEEAHALGRAIDISDWHEAKALLLRMASNASAERAGDRTVNIVAERDHGAWAPLIRDIVRQWDARTVHITKARKREALEHVLNAFGREGQTLYPRLKNLVRTWADSVPVEIVAHATPSQTISAAEAGAAIAESAGDDVASLLRELLAQTLTFGVVERLGYNPELAGEAQALAKQVREARSTPAVSELADRLKRFWIALEIRGDDQRDVQQGLVRLLHLLANNIVELVADDSWLSGQMRSIEALASGPIDRDALSHLESTMRETIFKQSTIKKSLDDAKDTLKTMVTMFIDRLGTMAENTGDYHDRMSGYATKIERADDLSKLSAVIGEVLQDTRGVQANLQRSRDDLLATRKQVDEHNVRIHQLESELASLSDRLHEDTLTSLLNRRGLARSFDAEASRADRQGEALCLAILDIDNFKNLNDTLGHQVGDQALVHLARVVREAIRPSDVISRYGGEEFVILLPKATQEAAVSIMQRVQRDLTRRFFLNKNERVLITFSAGVAQKAPGESQDDLVVRADAALYKAKKAGKNRVAAA